MLSRLMTRREQLVIVFLAGAVILGSVTIFIMQNPADSPALVLIEAPEQDVSAENPVPGPAVATPARAGSSLDEVVVSLVGAVARPGVYTLESGSRIQDLILAAGGPQSHADTSNINLAAMLIDGTTLIVPGFRSESDGDGAFVPNADDTSTPGNIPDYTISGWQTRPAGGASPGSSSGGLISLNRATQAELESLPGIGPKYAQEIIRYRTATPFVRTSDLMNVSGIGPKRYEALRGLVTVH